MPTTAPDQGGLVRLDETLQARISIWEGTESSDTTVACLNAFLLAVASAPTSGRILIVAPRWIIDHDLIDILQELTGGGVTHSRTLATATVFGRTIDLVEASSRGEQYLLGGVIASLVYVHEANLLPQGFWAQCLSRLRTPGAKLLATGNPGAFSEGVLYVWVEADKITTSGAAPADVNTDDAGRGR